MGKFKALQTALNNKLLGSHEHLEKGHFSLPRSIQQVGIAQGISIDSMRAVTPMVMPRPDHVIIIVATIIGAS